MMQKEQRDNESREQEIGGDQTNLLRNHLLETQKATPPTTKNFGWFVRLPVWSLVLLGLIAGLLIGVLVMRQRARAQEVVVAVNGVVINKEAFFHRLQIISGVPTMHKMVEETLQFQFAQKKGLAPAEAQVDAEYAKISQKPGFDQMLAVSGQTANDLKQNLRLEMAKSAILTEGITVSEAEARQYYQTQLDTKNPHALFYHPETITLRAIETQSRDEADKALTELAAETPFELVVATYSQDSSKNNGGLLNPLLRGRSPLHASPALEGTVFNLNVGRRLGPEMFNGHWWIFQCVDKSAASTVPYTAVRDQCILGAKVLKGGALNNQKIEAEFVAFQQSANMQAFWPQYQAAINTK